MSQNALCGILQASFDTADASRIREFKQEIIRVQDLFRKLPRAGTSVSELVSLKYKMQHWRQKMAALVMAFLDAMPSLEEMRVALEALAVLELKPSATDLQRLADLIIKTEDEPTIRLAAEYFAQLCEHALLARLCPEIPVNLTRLAGPRTELPLIANAPSKMTFKKWSKIEDFSNYQYVDGGVRFRGLQLRPGDILLSNVNRDGNGVYTLLAEPRGYGYHIGVFAIIEHEERRIPVVVEAYKLGVRVIPLSCFLASKFSSYAEALRPKAVPAGFEEAINRHVLPLVDSTKGYNFDTEDPDRSYLACTTVGVHLYELVGAKPVTTKSRYSAHPQVQRNLEIVDLMLTAFLSPTDFLIDENMAFVGVIDNNVFQRNLTRELCELHFTRIFRTMQVDPRKLPLVCALDRFGIRQIRAGTVLGKVIAAAAGFTTENLPKGTERILSVIETYEHKLKAGVRAALPQINKAWDSSRLVDVDRLSNDPAIVRILDAALVPVRDTCSWPEEKVSSGVLGG